MVRQKILKAGLIVSLKIEGLPLKQGRIEQNMKITKDCWRLLISSLSIVFISEMGDKTQITTMLLAGAKPAYVLWVALGSAMALIFTSFLEVIIGAHIIARFIKPSIIQLVSGAVFIVLGALLVFGLLGNIQLNN